MKIFGLSGKSGTGKSYNAGLLCGKLNIPALIDDGLFICDGVIVAGISAKKQDTLLGAVKTAIFTKPEHRAEVASAIQLHQPSSILVLGTSDDMVRKICERLEIPAPERIIHIEEITTKEERALARESRDAGGMHIIPAPTMQLKKVFSGYFLDPKRNFESGDETAPAEKTVVRPTYSYLGTYEVSSKVISDIAANAARHTEGVASLIWTASENTPEGLYVRIIVAAEKNARIRTMAEHLQRMVHDDTAYMTAFNMLGIEVEVRMFK